MVRTLRIIVEGFAKVKYFLSLTDRSCFGRPFFAVVFIPACYFGRNRYRNGFILKMSFILLIPVTEGFIPCETTSASCVIQLRFLRPCWLQSYDVCSDHEIYTFGLGVLYTVSVKIKTLNVLDEIKVQLKSSTYSLCGHLIQELFKLWIVRAIKTTSNLFRCAFKRCQLVV